MDQARDRGTAPDGAAHHERPYAVLDAGGATWHEIEYLVARRLEELRPGDRLEIVATDSSIALELPRWCVAHGYELIGSERTGHKTSFCLRTRTAATRPPTIPPVRKSTNGEKGYHR